MKWTAPTGAHPWENPGDTPYPDTEFQVRQMDLLGSTVAWLSSYYDPDWFSGQNLAGTPFSAFAPSSSSPGVATVHMGLFAVSATRQNPVQLAAETAGRSLALTLTTPNVGNLFEPGDQVPLSATVYNVTNQSLQATLSIQVWDYSGIEITQFTQTATFGAGATQSFAVPFNVYSRGVVFVAGTLTGSKGAVLCRSNVGVLPVRPASPPIPDSVFGISSAPALPSIYPDQFSMPTMLSMMQRIGIRRARSNWFDLIDNSLWHFKFDPQAVTSTTALLAQYGILPYNQTVGTWQGEPDLTQPPAVYTQNLTNALKMFGSTTNFMEVGNEVNLSGMNAADYVANYLVPTYSTTHNIDPKMKVLSMGFGGFQFPWIGDFENAGGMNLIDVLSIHPGTVATAPEHWGGYRGWFYRPQIQDALQMAGRHGKDVWATEAYTISAPDPGQIDARTSADYLVRLYVAAVAMGIRHQAYYTITDGDWYDQEEVASDIYKNYGLLYVDLTPKPAYVAYAAMTEQLEGATYLGRLDLGADDLYGVRFSTAAGNVDVLWSYREKNELDLVPAINRIPGEPWVPRWLSPVSVTLPVSGGVTVADVMGNSVVLDPLSGSRVSLSLTGSPIYVRGLGPVPFKPAYWGAIPSNGTFCSFFLPMNQVSLPAIASTGSYTISPVPFDCGFPPVPLVNWITATADGATVSYAVAANSTSLPRTGQIWIYNQPFTIQQSASGGPCDVGGDGIINVADAQAMINQALGANSAVNDLNGDGKVNIVDVQMVIDAALHLVCGGG